MIRGRRHALLAFGLAALAALAPGGCFVPTVPVPPPTPESISFALDAETETATYTADPNGDWPNSWVIIRNEQTGEGIVTMSRSDGSVGPTEPFTARDGDRILIGYENAEGHVAELCLFIHDGRSNSSNRCD
jgi:hypothetical protein